MNTFRPKVTKRGLSCSVIYYCGTKPSHKYTIIYYDFTISCINYDYSLEHTLQESLSLPKIKPSGKNIYSKDN